MVDDLDLLRTIARLARELNVTFDAHLRELGLTSARARVLVFLLPASDGASQAEVTTYLGVEHPTAVRILDGVEALGYVQRVPALEDRRAKMIVLTASGQAVATKVSRLIQELNSQLVRELDGNDMKVASAVLHQLLVRTQAIRSSVPDLAAAGALS